MRHVVDQVPPGEFIIDEFRERPGLRLSEMAESCEMSSDEMFDVLIGRTKILAKTAVGIARLLGTGPTIWLQLEKAYRKQEATKGDGK